MADGPAYAQLASFEWRAHKVPQDRVGWKVENSTQRQH